MVGPTIAVQPGPGKTVVTLEADRRACMAQTDAALGPIALRPDSTVPKIQALYNASFGQCMAARGNLVPVGTQVATGADGMATAGDPDSAAARQSLSGVISGFARSCEGERIEAGVSLRDLAPSVSARIVTLSTPGGGSCFGEPGQNAYLVVKAGTTWRTLLSAEPGSIEVTKSRHAGYADVELHSLGTCVYTYRWNGARYIQAGTHDCGTAAPPTMRTLPPAIRGRSS